MGRYLPLLILALMIAGCSSPAVQKGDGILMTYTGSYENGTIFDTNNPANSGVFDALPSHFTSMPVTVGKGQLISGVDNALVGMKKGETKKLLIMAKDGYGTYDSSKTIKVPIVTSTPSITTLQKEQVRDRTDIVKAVKDPSDIAIGKLITTDNFVFNITQVNATHVTLYLVGVGEHLQFTGMPWNSTVASQNSTAIVFRHIVEEGKIYYTSNGPCNATIDGEKITLTSALSVGGIVRLNGESARVLQSGSDSYLVDFNHPLAGYNLDFELTVDDIIPKK